MENVASQLGFKPAAAPGPDEHINESKELTTRTVAHMPLFDYDNDWSALDILPNLPCVSRRQLDKPAAQSALSS